MEELEQDEHTALAQILQWCCLVSVLNPTKQTWHTSCFLCLSLSASLMPGISRFTTFLLLPGTSKDSAILKDPLKEPINDLVRESLPSISLFRCSLSIVINADFISQLQPNQLNKELINFNKVCLHHYIENK